MGGIAGALDHFVADAVRQGGAFPGGTEGEDPGDFAVDQVLNDAIDGGCIKLIMCEERCYDGGNHT